ncbi:hypothetical protein D3C78_1199140 [compost metagenome]
MLGSTQQAFGQRELEHHEGEFATSGQYQPETHRRALVQPTDQTAHPVDQRQLQYDEQQRQPDHGERRAVQQAEVGTHAHADEEQSEQQALERFELRLQLMAIFRVGQQHTGEEGTKAHGYARHFHQPGGSHHH